MKKLLTILILSILCSCSHKKNDSKVETPKEDDRIVNKLGLIMKKDTCIINYHYEAINGKQVYAVTYKDKLGVYHQETFYEEVITIIE